MFIVCNSGLGHFRRCARVAHTLLGQNKNLSITIYCHPSKLDIAGGWPILDALVSDNRVSFKTTLSHTPQILQSPTRYSRENLFDWYQSIPYSEVMEADMVISDNLPGILNWRPDAILMGSFLWSEILPLIYPQNSLIQAYAETELDLLAKHKPTMICLNDMAMDDVREYTQPFGTGWVVESPHVPRLKKEGKTNILVSAGATGLDEEILVNITKEIAKTGDFQVFTSSRIVKRLDANYSNVAEFDFQNESFGIIDLMIARPGIGSITDAVAFGIPFIATGGNYNPELTFNAKRVEKLGYGLDFQDNSSEEILDAVYNILEPNKLLTIKNALHSAPKQGAMETAGFILNQLNHAAEQQNA